MIFRVIRSMVILMAMIIVILHIVQHIESVPPPIGMLFDWLQTHEI